MLSIIELLVYVLEILKNIPNYKSFIKKVLNMDNLNSNIIDDVPMFIDNNERKCVLIYIIKLYWKSIKKFNYSTGYLLHYCE